jgi:hypothetical protein
MKTPNIQNVFKMMIGTSALIASTAFFINTISPVQASENKEVSFHSELPTKTEKITIPNGTIVGCGSGIYGYSTAYENYKEVGWVKVGP